MSSEEHILNLFLRTHESNDENLLIELMREYVRPPFFGGWWDNEVAGVVTEDKWKAIHIAAAAGLVNVVRKLCLLDNGANVELTDSSNVTPLHVAALYGQVDCVRCLIGEFGASLEKRTIHNAVPLHNAAIGGHFEVVRCLIVEFSAD